MEGICFVYDALRPSFIQDGRSSNFESPGLFNEDINTIHTVYRDIRDKEAVLRELKNLLKKKSIRKALHDNYIVGKFRSLRQILINVNFRCNTRMESSP